MAASVLLGICVLVTGVERVAACGGFFCQQIPINQAGEQIIFRHDGNQVTAVILIQYAGAAEEFSWVVPVPGVPTVDVGSDLVFAPLELATRPQFNLLVDGEPCFDPFLAPPFLLGGAAPPFASDGVDESVTILSQSVVGPFDVTVVTSESADALATWLEENNYDLSDRGSELIAPYVEEGMNFVAVRLRQDQEVGDIQPLIIRYESDKPMIPIRLTAVAAEPDMGVIAWLLGDARAVPTNYLEVNVNYTRLDWFNGSFNTFATYQNLVTEAMDEAGGQGFAVDYAGRGLDVVSQLPDPAALREERDRLAALVNLDEFYVDLSFNRFFSQAKVLEILRRQLPLPVGLGEFAYSAPEVLFAQFDLETLRTARTNILAEIDTSVIEPLATTLEVFDGDLYMTRLFTTLSPEEMTLDPEFSFNPTIGDQPLERQATVSMACMGGQTNWTLTLGPGTGRDGEVVIEGFGEPPFFALPLAIDQVAVATAATIDAAGPAQFVTANTFEMARVGQPSPITNIVSTFRVCGQGIMGASMMGFCGIYLMAVSERRRRRRVD